MRAFARRTEETMSANRGLMVVSLLVSGCGVQAQDPSAYAVPSAQAVALTVPGQSREVAGETSAALVGQEATFYLLTHAISSAVNGGVVAILDLVRDITRYPATVASGAHRAWGPITSGLSPAEYRLDVEQVAPIRYAYVLSGKPKGADDSAYRAILAGQVDVIDEAHGVGDFLLDFDAVHALDSLKKTTGGIAVHYDNTLDPRVVDVGFKGFADVTGMLPADALYRYAEHADHSGDFEFLTRADLDKDGITREDLAMTSVWETSGVGRSSAVATGGSLGGVTVYAQECWGSDFRRTYYNDNVGMTPTEGDPAACPPAP
jgi:hypothetical protein